jgi:hypothetical protein
MNRIPALVDALVFARGYTVERLDTIPVADWFAMPAGCPTHVAWQVGHLACAEYRMALWRLRGAQPQDSDLISETHRQLFGYESVPDPDPAKYPSPADLRAVFDRVHEQVLREVRGLDEGELDQPVPHPHPFAPTKLRALLWCARHEMLHAGQIGLLRRQLGYPPLQ